MTIVLKEMRSLFGANGSFENFESSGDHPCNKADITFPFLFFLQIDALPDNGLPPSGNSGARIACCVIEEYKRKNYRKILVLFVLHGVLRFSKKLLWLLLFSIIFLDRLLWMTALLKVLKLLHPM